MVETTKPVGERNLRFVPLSRLDKVRLTCVHCRAAVETPARMVERKPDGDNASRQPQWYNCVVCGETFAKDLRESLAALIKQISSLLKRTDVEIDFVLESDTPKILPQVYESGPPMKLAKK